MQQQQQRWDKFLASRPGLLSAFINPTPGATTIPS